MNGSLVGVEDPLVAARRGVAAADGAAITTEGSLTPPVGFLTPTKGTVISARKFLVPTKGSLVSYGGYLVTSERPLSPGKGLLVTSEGSVAATCGTTVQFAWSTRWRGSSTEAAQRSPCGRRGRGVTVSCKPDGRSLEAIWSAEESSGRAPRPRALHGPSDLSKFLHVGKASRGTRAPTRISFETRGSTTIGPCRGSLRAEGEARGGPEPTGREAQ